MLEELDVGMIIKNMRLSAKLSQQQLAEKMSLARTTISSYEVNNSQPDFNTFLKICKFCGFEFELFKNGEKIDLKEMSKEKDY